MYPQYPNVQPGFQPAPGAPGYGMPAYPYPGQVSGPASPGMPAMPPASNGGIPQMPAMKDSSVGGGGSAAIRELEGRAVIAMPTRFETGIPGVGQSAAPQDRITLTVWVLDGGPLTYGANVQPPSPPTHRIDTVPCMIEGVLSSHANIIRATRGSLGADGRATGVVLGRIVRGVTAKAGNSLPWNLQPLDDKNPADQQARAVAQQVQQAVNAGTFVNPTPVDLAAQPAPAQQTYAPAPGTPYGQQPMVQQVPVDQPPAGIPPAFWATLSPEQKAAYSNAPTPF